MYVAAPVVLKPTVVAPTTAALVTTAVPPEVCNVTFDEKAFALGQIETFNELPREPAYFAAQAP